MFERTSISDLNNSVSPLVESDAGPSTELISSRRHTTTGGSGSGTQVAAAHGATALTFAGPSFNTVGADNGGYYMIPPDNASAAGANNVVTAVNGQIEVFSKTGTLQLNESLISFFKPLNPLSNFNDPNQTQAFDPKVVYDATSGRFVVVALEASDAGGPNNDANTSRILVAVSNGGDPSNAQNWHYTSINSDLVIGGNNSWADFPGLATDGSAIYITANMFDHAAGNYQGSRLWVVNQSSLAASAALDPSAASGATAAGPNELFTLQPAQMYGAPAGAGTYLVSYNGAPSKAAAGQALNIIHVTNPFAAGGPSFSYQQVNVGKIDSGGQYASFTAPQRGTSTRIDAGDNRALSVVWRNGSLYATADVLAPSGPDAGHVTAHWFQVSTTGTSLTLASQGNVSGSTIGSGVRTYYPSIAVDANNDFVVNFSASGPGLYASAYYAVHAATDPSGTLQTPTAFALGQASYVRTFGGGDNRWGDFSSITPDPASASGFWLFNEYAATQGTTILRESGRWATQVADVNVSGGAAASPLVASAGNSGTTNGSSPGSLGDQTFAQLVHSMAAFGGNGAVEGTGQRPFESNSHSDLFAAPAHHLG